MKALGLAVTLWKAPPTLSPAEDTWHVDAAYDDSRWTTALRTPARGMRIWRLPPWVTTQQGDELTAIEMATKTAAYEGLTRLHLVADNMSTIQSTIRNKSQPGARSAPEAHHARPPLVPHKDAHQLGRLEL